MRTSKVTKADSPTRTMLIHPARSFDAVASDADQQASREQLLKDAMIANYRTTYRTTEGQAHGRR